MPIRTFELNYRAHFDPESFRANLLLAFPGNPGIHARFQYRQGQRALSDHHVVKSGIGELSAERLSAARAQLQNFQCADFIAQCLRGITM